MYQITLKLLGMFFLVLSTVNCGGGGGTSATPATPIPFASSSIVADCAGTGCGASPSAANTYAGSGTGVWRFDNTANAPAIGTVSIQGLTAGNTVTLIYSNASLNTNAPTAPSVGTLTAPAAQQTTALASLVEPTNATLDSEHDHTSHGHMLQANHRLALEMRNEMRGASPAGSAIKVEIENAATPLPIIGVGNTRIWNENGFTKVDYATTAKKVCPAGSLGRNVVIWAQTSAYPSLITDAKLTDYQKAFCGTNNNDGAYAKVANAIGDVWGPTSTSTYSTTSIADTPSQKQDLNIVILDPGSSATWGGYFFSTNNRLKTTASTYANSNEALVFFVNARQSSNYTQSVLIHELTHMINYYQRWILNGDLYETWLEETTAMMTQDIFDDPTLTLNLLDGRVCVPTVCDLQSYAKSGANISYFNWPDTIDNNHYYMGAAFGAYLNRRFGPKIYLQLTTDCYAAPENTSGRTCLDSLIKANGGNSFDEEFAHFGASVFGKMGGGTGEPTHFGFPAQSGSVALKTTNGAGRVSPNFSYSIPAINAWWTTLVGSIAIPTSPAIGTLPYSTQAYRIDTVASGKTSYVRNNVSVPANTSLTVVVK